MAFQKQLCPVLSEGLYLIFLTCKATFVRPTPLAAASDRTAQRTETLWQGSATEEAEGMLLTALTHASRLRGLRQLLLIAITTAAVRAPAFQSGYEGCALPGRFRVSYHSVPALLISSHQHSVGSPRLWAAGMQA